MSLWQRRQARKAERQKRGFEDFEHIGDRVFQVKQASPGHTFPQPKNGRQVGRAAVLSSEEANALLAAVDFSDVTFRPVSGRERWKSLLAEHLAQNAAETGPDTPSDAPAAEIWANTHETATDAAHGQPEGDAARAEEGQATGGQGVPGASLPAETAAPSLLPSQDTAADTREAASECPSDSVSAGRQANTHGREARPAQGQSEAAPVFSLSGSGGELLERLAPLASVPGVRMWLQGEELQCRVPRGYEPLADDVCRGYSRALYWFLRAQGGTWASGAEGMAWLKAVALCWTVFEGKAVFFGVKAVA